MLEHTLSRMDSPIFVFFKINQDENVAYCKECMYPVKYTMGITRTSNLISHVKRRHKTLFLKYCKLRGKTDTAIFKTLEKLESLPRYETVP